MSTRWGCLMNMPLRCNSIVIESFYENRFVKKSSCSATEVAPQEFLIPPQRGRECLGCCVDFVITPWVRW